MRTPGTGTLAAMRVAKTAPSGLFASTDAFPDPLDERYHQCPQSSAYLSGGKPAIAIGAPRLFVIVRKNSEP